MIHIDLFEQDLISTMDSNNPRK